MQFLVAFNLVFFGPSAQWPHTYINNVFFFRLPVGIINTSHNFILVASEKHNICQDIKWHNRWNVVLKQHNNWPNRWVSVDFFCERLGVGNFFGVWRRGQVSQSFWEGSFYVFFWLEGGFWCYDVDITPLCLLDSYWHLIIPEWFVYIDSKEIPVSMGRTVYLRTNWSHKNEPFMSVGRVIQWYISHIWHVNLEIHLCSHVDWGHPYSVRFVSR